MKEPHGISASVEDYLKTIYELAADGREVNTSRIAEVLHVNPASVTNMLQRLTAMDPPLIHYQKHRLIHLTPQGRDVALRLLRRHRLVELFLVQVMGFSWEDVHREAEQLEHAISSKLEERMAHVLGNPLFEPHGKPIPTADLQVPDVTLVALDRMQAGGQGIIRHIDDRDPRLLRHLEELGLLPQARFVVLERLAFDDQLFLRVEGKPEPVSLGPQAAGRVMVTPL